MKKMILLITICLFLTTSCSLFSKEPQANNGDWSYKLVNDYEIWHINSQKIICGKLNNPNSLSQISEDYVDQFCYNSQYICLQCIDASDESIILNPRYYIIDTLTDKIDGPYNKTDFNQKISNFESLSSWIKTKPAPNGATFS